MSIVEKPPQTPPPSPTPIDTPTTFVQPEIPTPKPHKSNKLLFFIFVLVILGISLAIGIKLAHDTNLPTGLGQTGSNADLQNLADQMKQYEKQANDPNEPTSIPQGNTLPGSPLNSQPQTSTGQTTQTEQWQTYQNATAKFSLSYPANLKTKEASAGFGVNTIEFHSSINSAVPPEYMLLILPKVLGKTIGQDFDTYYAMKDNTSTIISTQGTSQKLTKLSNRTFSGQRAFAFQSTSQPLQAGETPTVGVYIEMGNNILIISTNQRNQASLNQMLTTFKYPL